MAAGPEMIRACVAGVFVAVHLYCLAVGYKIKDSKVLFRKAVITVGVFAFSFLMAAPAFGIELPLDSLFSSLPPLLVCSVLGWLWVDARAKELGRSSETKDKGSPSRSK